MERGSFKPTIEDESKKQLETARSLHFEEEKSETVYHALDLKKENAI